MLRIICQSGEDCHSTKGICSGKLKRFWRPEILLYLDLNFSGDYDSFILSFVRLPVIKNQVNNYVLLSLAEGILYPKRICTYDQSIMRVVIHLMMHIHISQTLFNYNPVQRFPIIVQNGYMIPLCHVQLPLLSISESQ